MTKLTVMFECSVENFGILMGTIGSSMSLIENFEVSTSKDEPKKKVTRQYAGRDLTNETARKVTPHSRVQQLILQTVEEGNGSATYADLEAAMIADGLSPKSVSAGVTPLQRAGLVYRQNNCVYKGKRP